MVCALSPIPWVDNVLLCTKDFNVDEVQFIYFFVVVECAFESWQSLPNSVTSTSITEFFFNSFSSYV